jgi:biopolymer transport protein ExbD
MSEDNLPETISIDVTPLATIALILVVIFISSASTWTQQSLLKVDLPKASTSESERKQNVTVSVSADDAIAIDDVQVTWESLSEGLRLALEQNKDRFVIIRADKSVTYGKITKIMGLSKEAGASSITIATTQKDARKGS